MPDLPVRGRAAADPYGRLRVVLAPQFASLSPEQLNQLFSGLLAEVDPEDLESLFGDIGKAFSSVTRTVSHAAQGATKAVGQAVQAAAPYVTKALPGIAQGAATGFTMGGPICALVGTAGGGALSAATGGKGLGGSGSPLGALGGILGGAGGGSPLGALGGLLGGAGGGSPVAGVLGQVLGGKPAISQLAR